MSLRWLSLLVPGAVLIGCAAPPDDELEEGPLSESSDAIAGGYADSTDTAVVGIVALEGQGIAICSGSLLAPNMVLTARHCVSDTLNDNNGVNCSITSAGTPFNATNFYVTTDQSMDQNGTWYQGREVVVLPTDNKFCGQDQAILILAENIPAEAATPYIPRVDSPLVKNEEYYAVGYGATNDSGSGSGLRRRRDDLTVYCAETECQAFDQYVKVTEWIGDTGICSGDSGGPALDLQNRVVGVTSRGGANCSSPVYGSVHSWGQWIKDTAIHAAELGGYDAPKWATGWPTDPAYNEPVGDSCDTGCPICVNDVCTRACSDDFAPCDEGYLCQAFDDGAQYCQPEPEPEPTKKKKKKPSDSADTEDATDGGCSAGGREDPTNPVPWRAGVFALAALAFRSRRRARRTFDR
ncbi:MAG: trypsin-like serine protease [Myxococcales bacterium]|nr:trypsin-like serine protease [Myxococcales bacterium]